MNARAAFAYHSPALGRALPAALLLSACAVPTHYAGIDLRPESLVAPEVQSLAGRAQNGDKQSQLDLGIRYEEGRGVPQDPKRARALYRMAATQTGSTIFVYVPASRKGGHGYVTPVNTGPIVPGLAAARERLNRLKARAVRD
jgi:Sel1 repeat